MSWNYRMIRTKENETYVYHVHEVYYDKNGKPKSWSENPITPYGESQSDGYEDLILMQKSFQQKPFDIVDDKLVEINVGKISGK